MKNWILLAILILPVVTSAQNLIYCNDSLTYFINKKDSVNLCIELNGRVSKTEHEKVVNYKNYPIQTVTAYKKNYLTKGNDEISILVDYIMSETRYFSNLFEKRLELEIIPFELNKNKKALIWNFDIPQKTHGKMQPGEHKAIKQIQISVVDEEYIFSIGTTQFENQEYKDLEDLLKELIVKRKFKIGDFEPNELCY